MPVKGLLKLLFTVSLLVSAAVASAQGQPRSMLGDFDLKSAVLSPAPLGPPSQFEPRPTAAPEAAKQATREAAKPATAAKRAIAASEKPRKVVNSKPHPKSAVVARKPKASPVESYARDERRQTWPCSGAGICAWTRQQ